MASLYELYLLYVRERRGTVAALFLLSILGTVSLFAVLLFWQVGERVTGDIQRSLGAGTVVVMGGPFSDRDLAAALSLGCFSGGYGVSVATGVLRYPNGTTKTVTVAAVPAGVRGVAGAAATANAYYAKAGETYRVAAAGKELTIYVKEAVVQMASMADLYADIYVDRALLGNLPYNYLVLQKAGRSCVKELRGLFPRAAVMDSDEFISALWGQLLLYLGSAALVALSTTAAVAALVYTYATTMYYTHFKEFAILRTLGLKKRGLAALALMLFALPAAAGSLTATALALTVEAPVVSTAQIALIPPAVVTVATLLASAPALRRLYAITPAEALRTE